MVESVTLEASTFQPPPLRFEAGTPSIAEVIGLGAAIDYINAIGKEECHTHLHALQQDAAWKLSSIRGLKLIGTAAQKGPILSFFIEGVHALDLGTMLGLKGIAIRTGHLCAQPLLNRFKQRSLARLSFGIYNTFDEIEKACSAIREIIQSLNPNLLG